MASSHKSQQVRRAAFYQKHKIFQFFRESQSSEYFNYTSATIFNSITVVNPNANPNARAFTPEQYDMAERILGIVSYNTLFNNVFCK